MATATPAAGTTTRTIRVAILQVLGSANVRHVDLDLARTRELYELPAPPYGHEGCQECAKAERLVRHFEADTREKKLDEEVARMSEIVRDIQPGRPVFPRDNCQGR